MKILIIFTLSIVLAACFKPANAGEWSATVFQRNGMTDEDYYSRGAWYGVQVNYEKKNKTYYFISNERAEVQAIGRAFDYNMTGFGMGKKYQLTEDIKLFGQFGYYIIENSWGDRKYGSNESLMYYLHERWAGSYGVNNGQFQMYAVENDNAFAGTLGIELDHKFTKNLAGHIMFSYRLLTIQEMIRGMNDGWQDTGYWAIGLKRNYSSYNFGLGLTYSF